MQTLKGLLDSPAVNVVLGTLPLLLTLALGLFQNDRRMTRMENSIDSIGTKIDGLDSRLSQVSERLARVETKIETAPKLVS